MSEIPAIRPPRSAGWIVERFVGGRHAESVPGDLAEEFIAVAARIGPAAARRWYWRQAGKTIPHLVWSQLRLAPISTTAMVFAGLALLGVVDLGFRMGARALLSRYSVYEHISAGWFWRMVDAGRFVIGPIAIGWLMARMAKGREMAVTSLVGVALAVVFVWNAAVIALYLQSSPPGTWRNPIVVDVIHHGVTVPLSVLIGGIVRRQGVH
jgi:hypothetical protein